MGHEFTGIVVQAGSSVQSVKIGDKVVSPFTVSWYGRTYAGLEASDLTVASLACSASTVEVAILPAASIVSCSVLAD